MAGGSNQGYDGDQPQRYMSNCAREPAFVRDGLRPYYGAVPVTFRQPPFYDDHFVRHSCHHQPNFGSAGHLHPEQVLVWREEDQCGAAGPWWRNSDCPHSRQDGHPILIVERPECEMQCSEQITVELYVPLCCDNCVRKVKTYLIDSQGVESVTADQWEKKVVVVGRNFRPHDLLQSLRRHLDLPLSTFWEQRPQ